MQKLRSTYRPTVTEYLFSPLSHRDKSILYRKMFTALDAGLNYKKLMGLMQPKNPGQNNFFKHIRHGLKNNLSLPNVFLAYPVIPRWQAEWIYLAERTGSYDKVFSDLSTEESLLGRQMEQLKSKLTRPVLTLLLACFLTSIDRLILGEISVKTYLIISMKAPFLLVLAYFMLKYLYRSGFFTHSFKLSLEKFGSKIPKLRTYLAESYAYRFSSSLLYAVEAGMPINRGIEMATRCTGSHMAELSWGHMRMSMRSAYELPTLLSMHWFLSFSAINFITIGVKSGKLDTALAQIRKESQERSQEALTQLCRLVSLAFELFVMYSVATTFMGGVV